MKFSKKLWKILLKINWNYFKNWMEFYEELREFLLKIWMLRKLPIISKNCSNKSCWELNFIQNSQWAHMSICPKSRTSGIERLVSLKYYKMQKQESGFTRWLNTDKIIYYIKKLFKWKLLRIEFRMKKSVGAQVYLSQEWS